MIGKLALKDMKEKIDELVECLNYYTELYDKGTPELSDRDWDSMYFDLQYLEGVTGYYRPDSPTQCIKHTQVNELNRVTHNHLMLSLDKTKDLNEIQNFLNQSEEEPYVCMGKMDGLSMSLLYEDGKLVRAETRGADGIVGEDVTHNAKVIKNLPVRIDTKDRLVIDGEVILKTDDFLKLKETNPEFKNQRNIAAGSIRLLNSEQCAARNLCFLAWDVIEYNDNQMLNMDYLHNRMSYIKHFGFNVAPCILNDTIPLEKQVEIIKKECNRLNYPIDGCVFKFDSMKYGETLGKTEHHFKNAMAYKFHDELYETVLEDIEWSMGRTGVLTPVAVFEDIEIDNTTVNRASLHNYSIMSTIKGGPLFKGQSIKVFKANQIIPQISEVIESDKEDNQYFSIPSTCPVCGGNVELLEEDSGVVNLYCMNPNCEGKAVNKFDHFCGTKGLDIKGLSKKTLEKLLEWKWIADYEDIFELAGHRDEWVKKSGFGATSVDKILRNIQSATIDTSLSAFISALGIPLIGKTVAKEIENRVENWNDFRNKVHDKNFDFSDWDGFGVEKNLALKNYDYLPADIIVDRYITFKEKKKEEKIQTLKGVTVVITGKLSIKRDEFKALIEAAGGKVTGSVTKNTNYLVTDNPESGTAKNKKAKELGVTIISESDFRSQFEI